MSSVGFIDTPPGVQEERLAAFEADQGFVLPDRYRRFLLRQNGGRPEDNMHFVDAPNGPVDVSASRFFGVDTGNEHNDLERRMRFMQGRFPEGIIPIGDAPCGDLITLSIDGQQRGAVWLWNHEFEADEDERADYRNMTFVAPNFDAFLAQLQPFVDPGQAGAPGSR